MVTRKGRAVINSRGYSGVTPLTVAMRKRAGLYVNFLLQKGADPNLAEKNGDTPLIIAARSGYIEGVDDDDRGEGHGRRDQPPGRDRADHGGAESPVAGDQAPARGGGEPDADRQCLGPERARLCRARSPLERDCCG